MAISVSAGRLAKAAGSGQAHRIRAYAALVAFVNALAVSLFALIPGDQIGTTALVVSILGLSFVMASLLSLIRLQEVSIRLRQVKWTTVWDVSFLVGLAVAFVYQLLAAVDVLQRPGDSGSVETIAYLVVVCFLVGIARAWELIGGPSIGIGREVAALLYGEKTVPASSGDTAENAENAENAEPQGKPSA